MKLILIRPQPSHQAGALTCDHNLMGGPRQDPGLRHNEDQPLQPLSSPLTAHLENARPWTLQAKVEAFELHQGTIHTAQGCGHEATIGQWWPPD